MQNKSTNTVETFYDKWKKFFYKYKFYILDGLTSLFIATLVLVISMVVAESLMGETGFWYEWSNTSKALLRIGLVFVSLIIGCLLFVSLNKPFKEYLELKIKRSEKFQSANAKYLRNLRISLESGASLFLLAYIVSSIVMMFNNKSHKNTYLGSLAELFLGAEYWNVIKIIILFAFIFALITFLLLTFKKSNVIVDFIKENRNPLVLISRIGDYIHDLWVYLKKNNLQSFKWFLIGSGGYILLYSIITIVGYVIRYGAGQTLSQPAVYVSSLINSLPGALIIVYFAFEIRFTLFGRVYKILPERFKENVKGYLYVAPALVALTVFTVYPIFSALLMGFVKFDMSVGSKFNYYNWKIDELIYRLFFDTQDFLGRFTISNFVQILTHDLFWKSIITTLFIVFITVPISTIISLVIAVLLNSIKKLQGLYQTLFFLPYVTSMTAVAAVWRWIFYYDNSDKTQGLLNIFMKFIGLDPMNWLMAPDPLFSFKIPMPWLAKGFVQYDFYPQLIAFMIYSIWAGLAFKIVVFLTGLQGIDKQYYQAARIDGAGRFKIFRRITIPLLTPIIVFITTTSFMGAFQTFTSIKTMFLDNKSIMTIVYYLYDYIDARQYDRAAAAAVILFSMISVFTIVRFIRNRNKGA